MFEAMDRLVQAGKIRCYGVSVEKVEEALKAIEYPGVSTVQVIFNMFRQRPADLFFREAVAKDVGIIVRVPLASGLLTGKYDQSTTFGEGDHRIFNREGAVFDKGETFAGVPYDSGLDAVEEIRNLIPEDQDLAALALRWILDFDEVSTIIPGMSRPEQLPWNLAALELEPLSGEVRERIEAIYERSIKPLVHPLW
jgi:aryl-alcohol dehydrogenase-like predicted oxidoreductase